MSGQLLHVGANVTCAHSGTASPSSTNARVTVSGQPTALLSASYLVSACTFPPPNAGNGPCVSATWSSGTVRVTSTGQPLAILGGSATCTPTGTPLLTLSAQTRVVAS
jgi:hypothetical protein